MPALPPRRIAALVFAFAGAASAAHADEFARRPYAQAATHTACVLRWIQNSDASARIDYGLAGRSDDLHARGPAGAGAHEVTLDHLQPGARYHYRVEVGATRYDGEFATAAPPDQPFTFLVYGDDRTWDQDHRTVVSAMESEGADFLVNTGDIVANCSAAAFDRFFRIESSLLARSVLFPALGNHELLGCNSAALWQREFFTPSPESAHSRYYAFDWGNARLVILDFNEMSAAQDAWLAGTLAEARERGVRHIVAFMHHGPFSSGEHGENAAARKRWVPLFRQYEVDLLVSGHDHDYERGFDADSRLHFVVSGGGGAPLYTTNHQRPYQQKFIASLHYLVIRVAGPRITVLARRPDGTVLDEFTLSTVQSAARRPPPAAR